MIKTLLFIRRPHFSPQPGRYELPVPYGQHYQGDEREHEGHQAQGVPDEDFAHVEYRCPEHDCHDGYHGRKTALFVSEADHGDAAAGEKQGKCGIPDVFPHPFSEEFAPIHGKSQGFDEYQEKQH